MSNEVFKTHGNDLIRPARNGFAITAGASELVHQTRGLYVGVTGNVTVTLAESGDSVQFVNLAAGIIHPINATHVTAATATDIVGLY